MSVPQTSRVIEAALADVPPSLIPHPGSREFRGALRAALARRGVRDSFSRRELARGVEELRRRGEWPAPGGDPR